MLNEPMEYFRRQLRHGSRQLGRAKDAIEQLAWSVNAPKMFRHETAILPASARNKQS
jgi:hypothetical protein